MTGRDGGIEALPMLGSGQRTIDPNISQEQGPGDREARGA